MRPFDWGSEDCYAFHDAVKKHFLPIIDKLVEQRKATLKLYRVRPYDMSVDCFGREPLRIHEKAIEYYRIFLDTHLLWAILAILDTHYFIRRNSWTLIIS
jgi:hypothetical protein